ncbi:MAG: hypothetical protein V2B18_23595, partial [Pseudomonadota bacterium]
TNSSAPESGMLRCESLHPRLRFLSLLIACFLALLCTDLLISLRTVSLEMQWDVQTDGAVRVSWKGHGQDYVQERSVNAPIEKFQTGCVLKLMTWGRPEFLRLEYKGGAGGLSLKTLKLRQYGFGTVDLLAASNQPHGTVGLNRELIEGNLRTGQGGWALALEPAVPKAPFDFADLRFSVLGPAFLSMLMAVVANKFVRDYRLIRRDGIWLSIAMIIAGVMVIGMAYVSPFNSHSDEVYHLNAAKYYRDHWLPPKPCEEAALDSYSNYGVTYLSQLDIVYFLAGKFSLLILPRFSSITDLYGSLRLFNVLLFMILVGCTLFSARRGLITALVITPQLWYVFSYFNGDAFPFLLAFLLGWYLTRDDNGLTGFLRAEGWAGARHGVAFGLLLGALSISKLNYCVFVAFASICVCLLIPYKGRQLRVLKKILLIFLAAGLLFGVRLGIHLAINGTNSTQLELECAERTADPECKPSQLGSPGAKFGMRFREQGVKYWDVLTHYHWTFWSWRSFFGLYGWMEFPGRLHQTVAMSLAALVLLIWVLFLNLVNTDLHLKIVTSLFLLLSTVSIFLATYNSWVFDWQPQGRYLFPILAMFSVVAAPAYDKNPNIAYPVMVAFGAAGSSFVAAGLYRWL